MKQFKTLLGAAVLILSALSCQKMNVAETKGTNLTGTTGAAAGTLTGSGDQLSTSYIIMSQTFSVSQDLLSQVGAMGTVTASMPELGLVVANSSAPNFASTLSGRPDVLSVTPDMTLNWLQPSPSAEVAVADSTLDASAINDAALSNSQLGLTGTNPFVPDQWNIWAVNAPTAFRAGYKGQGAIVADLDGGFALANPDIAPNILTSISFVPHEPAQFGLPGFSHGTHTAGIIAAADNNVGTVGIAPSAKLMLVKVLNDKGSGAIAWIINGVYYAASHGANIINMSFGLEIPRNGGFTDANGTRHDAKDVQQLIIAMNRAFQFASKNDVLCVAAAGNNGTAYTGQGTGTFYPASCTDVLAVSATGPLGWGIDQTTSLYPFAFYSDYGHGFINFSGPGGNLQNPPNTKIVTIGPITAPAYVFDFVLSPGNTHAYYFAIGTSMATPAVSAVAALIAGKYDGTISAPQLKTKLFNSVIDLGAPGVDAYYGRGQVDAGLAIQQ